MSDPVTKEPVTSEFDALCDAVFDGGAAPGQIARLEALALDSPALRRRYVELADQEATLTWGEGESAAPALAPAVTIASTAAPPPRPVWKRRRVWAAALAMHTALTACLFGVWLYQPFKPAPRRAPPAPPGYYDFLIPAELPAAVWTASAGADLFGGAAPAAGDVVPVGREQALRSGWAKLRFATGAEAVLEGPAVFEVAAADRLILRAGRCSVHAPVGAEGFVVETPDGRVVDLGTRFAVRVREGSAEADGGTEVHVVEGAAELHPAAEPVAGSVDRLSGGQARRLAGDGPLPFDPHAYRDTLPDRVVSYVARDDADGATTLTDLTVQRAGRARTYAAAALTPATLSPTNAPAGGYVYAVPATATGTLADWLNRPFVLNAGHINPGGSIDPPTADPVSLGPDAAAGLVARFDPPVTNAAGPDLVLFDVQSVVDVPAGDAFHLSPVKFRPGLRSITVRRYDLTVGDAGAAVVAPFVLPRPDGPERSPEAVPLTAETPRLTPSLRFTANAVAVDLSELGYDLGEAVGELFVQDARDDPKLMDPTLIVGLPADRPSDDRPDPAAPPARPLEDSP